MRFDMHVHVAPENTALSRRPIFRFLARKLAPGDQTIPLAERLSSWLETATQIDRFVLLALDQAHTSNGEPDPQHTALHVPNDFVTSTVATNAKALFGASVHPYRRDALQELEQVITAGACLIKWIPSTQRICPDDPRCQPFYERMAEAKLPLLVHTGIEHATAWHTPAALQRWNDPGRLRLALRCGVKVIAAHCAARIFLHEQCSFNEFCRLALEYEHLYGDISAFGVPTRIGPLLRLLRTPALCRKILYGSDFPALVMPRWFTPWIGRRAVREVLAESNPLDRTSRLMRAMGVPDAVFERAGNVLRLPG